STATVAGGGSIVTANDQSADPTTVAPAPDLSVAMAHTGAFRQGDAADTYTIAVGNVGFAPTDGTTVTATGALPAGLTPTSFTGTGWRTSISGQTVTATRSDALAAGFGYDALILTVSVADDAAALLSPTLTASGGGDIVAGNDTFSDQTIITQVADLT